MSLREEEHGAEEGEGLMESDMVGSCGFWCWKEEGLEEIGGKETGEEADIFGHCTLVVVRVVVITEERERMLIVCEKVGEY